MLLGSFDQLDQYANDTFKILKIDSSLLCQNPEAIAKPQNETNTSSTEVIIEHLREKIDNLSDEKRQISNEMAIIKGKLTEHEKENVSLKNTNEELEKENKQFVQFNENRAGINAFHKIMMFLSILSHINIGVLVFFFNFCILID